VGVGSLDVRWTAGYHPGALGRAASAERLDARRRLSLRPHLPDDQHDGSAHRQWAADRSRAGPESTFDVAAAHPDALADGALGRLREHAPGRLAARTDEDLRHRRHEHRYRDVAGRRHEPGAPGRPFRGASDACCTWATDQRFALPNDLLPGASTTFTVSVTAPTAAGPYVLRHRMVKEGVAWFSQIQKTNVTVGTLTASYSSTPPTTWQVGVPRTYAITVTNTGTQTWTTSEPYPVHLAVHFGDASDACCTWATDQRIVLPNDLPGADQSP